MTKKTEKTSPETSIVKAQPQTLTKSGQEAHDEFRPHAQIILLPRILIMQPQSPQVLNDDKNKNEETRVIFGDLLETLDNRVIGNPSKPLLFIPFKSDTNWIVREQMEGKKAKFIRFEPFTGLQLPLEEIIGGKKFIRTLSINVYGLIPDEIAAGNAMPYLFAFRSTSIQAGRKINTIMFMKNRAAKRDPWASVIEISVQKTKNDKGSFATVDVRQIQSRGSSPIEMEACAFWYDIVKSGTTQVVDIDNVDEVPDTDSSEPATSEKF